ncbi:hypothetical protein B0T19DRAFT_439042 [Cercophora scortea]|uniref:Uncharacterized protein n=1 Tax=Cercophora scortea TaxID=314031 RepID=A0AAE0IVT0_9PEZI|nr:hypothetical protein B0T19DRAFT_439042 [Cercophora scortea]
MSPRPPLRAALAPLIVLLCHFVVMSHGYNRAQCCFLANTTKSIVPDYHNKTTPLSDVKCGQVYQDQLNPAPGVFITYGFCRDRCGGWGSSTPEQWAAPLVQFLLPSVIFSMNIPRRLLFVSSDMLRRLIPPSRHGLGHILVSALMATLALLCATLDTIIWVITIMGMAGPMTAAGLHEALLDHKCMRSLLREAHVPSSHRENAYYMGVQARGPEATTRGTASAGPSPSDEHGPGFEDAGFPLQVLRPLMSNGSMSAPSDFSIERHESGYETRLLPQTTRVSDEHNAAYTAAASSKHTETTEVTTPDEVALRNKVEVLVAVLSGNLRLQQGPNNPLKLIPDALLASREKRTSDRLQVVQSHTAPALHPTITTKQDIQISTEPQTNTNHPPRNKPPSSNSKSVGEQLRQLMKAQSAFGAAVGAPVAFYLGTFFYTILDLLNKKSDEDTSISLAFGVEWMIIVHVAIVNGCLLASNNPSPVTMLVGRPAVTPPTSSHRRMNLRKLFPPVYDGIFQPVSMWHRGRNKQEWLERTRAWQDPTTGFRAAVSVSRWEYALWIAIPTFILTSLPPAAGAVVAHQTPPTGWGCRSLSFATYGAFQTVLTPVYLVAMTRTHTRKGHSSLSRLAWNTAFGILFFFALFTSVGTTLMQIMGVYRNCICYVNAEWWLSSLGRAKVNVASDTLDQREASGYWIKMGITATGFMVAISVLGWLFQVYIRERFERVIAEMEEE